MRFPAIRPAALFPWVVAPAFSSDEAPLDRDGVIERVSEQTAPCRQEKDQRMCSNYVREDDVIQRIMHDDGERRDGVWFVDDRLCILWKAGIKPLCFGVLPAGR